MLHGHIQNRFLFVALLFVSMLPWSAQADILLNKQHELNLFGDIRYRYEKDERSGDEPRERTRSLLRARIGASFKPNKLWMGKLRLSTNSSSSNSRDTTQSTSNTDKNDDFGLDQAFVAYTPSPLFNMVLGKADFAFYQQNEVFMDKDINPEAVSIITNLGGLSFSGTRITLIENDWNKDVTADAYQMVYRNGGISFAYGVATIDGHKQYGRDTNNDSTNDVLGFQSDEYTIITAEEKRGNWVFGIEYITSNSDSADTARILSYEQQLGPAYGFRIYKYMVEGMSVMGDGMFSQNDFPVEGNTGVSNFEGYKLQIDFITSKTSSVDLSFYEMERIHDPASLRPTASDAIMTRNKQKRMQLNFNVQF
ncbi:MAG: putative porin [Gammaproteobacteria bacterium]|nr:putative porin [Gammaproteobacteria bacterium]